MKADRKVGEEEGGPDDLRTLLDHWTVPGPPLEIEEALRRTFRSRPSRWRYRVGLAAAAVLTLLLLYQVTPLRQSAPPGLAERAVSTPSPVPLVPSAPTAELAAVESRTSVRSTPRVSRARPTPSGETLVVIEPGQADLLVRFARQLQGTRQVPPGASLPQIDFVPADAPASAIQKTQAKDDVLSYRTNWEKVGSEWPLVQRSL
jgi:hypothetical protein